MRTFLLTGTSLLALSASMTTASADPIVGCSQNSVCFSDTGAFQTYPVPQDAAGTYDIVAGGAKGGAGGNGAVYGFGTDGGYGARLEGDVNLTAGDVLNIVVGSAGSNGVTGGGGGGSFVIDKTTNAVLMVAGGGGGGGYSVDGSDINIYHWNAEGGSGHNGGSGGSAGGGGGGGTGSGAGGGGGGVITAGGNGDGSDGGQPVTAGGVGGAGSNRGGQGGFGGGGGGGAQGGGGGGGFSGGGGGGNDGGGGGAGASAFYGVPSHYLTAINAGDSSYVTITDLSGSTTPARVPEPASLALFGAGLAGLGLIRRRARR